LPAGGQPLAGRRWIDGHLGFKPFGKQLKLIGVRAAMRFVLCNDRAFR
jgi:hypothetical protein